MRFSRYDGMFFHWKEHTTRVRERTAGMQEVTFDLQTLTPLFLAGNDRYRTEIPRKYVPRGLQLPEEDRHTWQIQAEIRPPSLRGLMRYWQRALVGGVAGTDTEGLTKIREVEQGVFGATDRGSAVSIRVTDISNSPLEYEKESYSRDTVTGRDYLFWSMAKSGSVERGTLRIDRKYFPSNTTFKIILSSRDQDVTSLNRAIAALWLMTNLGGIGSRSRRCAGSLLAKPLQALEGSVAKLSFKEPASTTELRSHLQDGIKAIRKLYADLPQRPPREATFDALSSGTCKIWILSSNERPWTLVEDAMTDIGEKLHAYRETIKPPERRAVFGLPLMIRDLADRRLKRELEEHRYASPLLLRITKLQQEYVCVAVLFKTKAQNIPLIPPRDYTLIEKWTNMFTRKETVDL
jgi:CRISPR-associated protein Cmr1